MSIDPEHVKAAREAIADIGMSESEDELVSAGSKRLLTSTDPAVHEALLAALVRAGVLEEESESATLRMFGGKVVMRKARSRFVTAWEETCD